MLCAPQFWGGVPMRLHVPSLCHSLQRLGCQRDLEQACFFHIAEEGVTAAHGGENEVQRKQGMVGMAL